ncbi:acyltransferase family protein [Nonomuraea phyllanthi]|uniref:Acyltransferase family protein n=1 Tax=Nonomuraea phyllanthi TaxID=2219224 RepID=A0A5C4W1G3_9ACTN|nr:acyltransferase [Nonomuraea phyllanthi]KAB8190915.1 acyltransferase family protein [Nonomuraea phyllanthi]
MALPSVQKPARDAERRTDLDSLRILMVVGLVFFHSALVFDAQDDFYVRNAETADITVVLAALGVLWAMPMLFFVAGLGAWHSLRRRGTAGFVAERLRRLGVPLVVATVAIVPVPQWLRVRSDPAQQLSYPEFLSRFFHVHVELHNFPFFLEGEYFETGHLWFLVMLLTFCLMLAPVTHWVRSSARTRAMAERLGDRAAAYALRRRGSTLLPALLLGAFCALAGLEQEYAGWHRWAYLIFFLLGFVFTTDPRFRAALRRDTPLVVVAGAVLFLVGVPVMLSAGDGAFTELTPLAMTGRLLYGAAGWCWLTSILGVLDRPRRARRGPAGPPADLPGAPPEPPGPRREPRRPAGEPSRWRAYLGEAVLPLYVLHQPIVVAVAFLVVRWDAPIAVKYVAIVAISLAVIATTYHFLVRRTRVTRFLLGMRPRP